jgi:hypothetical protein
MKRLLRWAVNGATVVSAVLFVAVCVLWVRSYWVWERWFACREPVGATQWTTDGYSARGTLGVSLTRADGFSLSSAPREGRGLHSEDDLRRVPKTPAWPGFRLGKESDVLTWDYTASVPPVRTTWLAVVPYWFFAAAMAALALLGLRHTRRRMRRLRLAAGLCPSCGYDLRATPARCPECGAQATIGK